MHRQELNDYNHHMVDIRDIRQAAQKIARQFQPERIVLFGSYAYGQPDEHSDVDLLIVMKGQRVHDRGVAIREAIDFAFPVDLVVRSPDEVRKRIAWGDYFLQEIDEKGKVLYEATDARVGEKGRRRFFQRATRDPGKKKSQLR